MLATVTQAPNEFAGFVFILADVLLFVGLACVAQGVHAAWHGERLLRSRSGLVSSVRSGHVVLSGVVEPAWSLLSSPFSRETPVWEVAERPAWSTDPHGPAEPGPEEPARPANQTYVYYEALTIQGSGRSSHTVFHEKNAVPFILNDGTGRVLVLGRRARWDAATSLLDLHGDEKSIAEGDTTAQIAALLAERKLLAAPDPTYRKGDPEESGRQSESSVAVGERVTVIGRAAADDRAVRPADACLDDGSSFGLPGLYRVGPEPLWGLDVMAGSARDVTVRGRLRLIVGLLGVLALAAAAASGALALTSHVLPPSGSIAFGTSFDSWSGVQGQAATLSSGQSIVAVADFNGNVHNGDVVRVLVDGNAVASWTAEGGKYGPGACEIDFGPGAFSAGQHSVDVLGPGDDELAGGTVSAGP